MKKIFTWENYNRFVRIFVYGCILYCFTRDLIHKNYSGVYGWLGFLMYYGLAGILAKRLESKQEQISNLRKEIRDLRSENLKLLHPKSSIKFTAE